VPFRRPAELAEDVPSELVTQHAVRFLEDQGYRVDIAVTLQPTTPFIQAEDIDACVNKLVATGADSVITVSPVRERPEWMVRLGEGERMEPLMNHWWSGEEGISQNLPRLYVPNGGAYATRRDVLMLQNRIIGADARAVVMPLERSVDIDEPIDFALAETWLAERAGAKGTG
jgi:CMP-N-acetylneuraminic acid synthetase